MSTSSGSPALPPSPTESPLSTTPRAPLPSRVPLSSLPGLDNLDDFPEPPSGQSRGTPVSSAKKPLSPTPNPVVSITSTPTPTAIALPDNQHESNRLSSGLFQGSRSSPSRRISDFVWRKKVNETDTPSLTTRQLDSPSASWWGEQNTNAKSWDDPPQKAIDLSPEVAEAWTRTKESVSTAIKSVLDVSLDVFHELLVLGSDFLEFAPIPGLSPAARSLVEIWDAVQKVDLNTLTCLRLTGRCAETLISVRQEVHDAGSSVTLELQGPLHKLQEAFENVKQLFIKEAHRPFIKRYLKRDDIMRSISACDADIRSALDMFNLSVSIRILKQTQESERNRHVETEALLAAMQRGRKPTSSNALMLTGITEEVTSSPPQSPQSGSMEHPAVPPKIISQMSEEQLRAAIASLHLAQNISDQARDTENLRQLMRLALHTTRDADILEILQIKRQDMPEAIKSLQRALERVTERDRERQSSVVVTPKPPPVLRKFSSAKDGKATSSQQRSGTIDSNSSSATSLASAGKGDTLDREFLESGIEALVRMSRGVDTNLPSWTITKYEVDRDQKIGIGFFSDVYKGSWRNYTVAIKVLADTTPRELFKREVAIWKALKHPNVLELYGASSTAGDPPWFFVSPYEKNGSLNEFLKKVRSQTRLSGSSFGSRKSPLFSSDSLPPVSDSSRAERQAAFPIWSGVNSGPRGQPRIPPVQDPNEHRRSRDLHRFIYEIAKGMAYLHSQNVHHGDLKTANVLVDDSFHCVISDFGQSEMKSEAFSISGAAPPHGTLRWQAPELMRGSSHLTKQMDIYSYAITCVEILNWGSLPWAYIDDFAIRRLVLDNDERPPWPVGSKYVTQQLQDLVRACWDQDPAKRPSFADIVPLTKSIRKATPFLIENFSSPRISELPELGLEDPIKSPDIRPIVLPIEEISSSRQPDDFGLADSDQRPHKETSVPTPEIRFPEPVFFSPTGSRQSSVLVSPLENSEGGSHGTPIPIQDTHASPPPENDIIAQIRNERRYRMILTHDYHPSLVLPLWEPSHVDVGAVGYLSKPRGAFITLFNALHPNMSSLGTVRALPKIDGYGRVTSGSQRVPKRNQIIDTIMGLLTLRKQDTGMFPQPVSRRYSFPLKAGHRAAFLCAQATEYRYMISEEGEQLDAPKRWFKANVDAIMKIFGAQHQIQREELFLVVGTLRAPNYALFVSHNHPEGHVHFNVFSSPKNGRPWGIFTTDSDYEGAGPSIDIPDESSCQSASKVSSVRGGPWNTVLVSRLRFKPDGVEPTTL